MNLGEDFVIRDDLVGETAPIELKVSEYSGVIYRYLKISIVEKEDSASVNFEFDILDPGKFKKNKLKKDTKFHQYIGLVLNRIILDISGEGNLNESGSGNTPGPTEESGLLQEGTSIPQV